jgi:hypothetical protein
VATPAGGYGRRRRLSTETKQAFKTTEFWTFLTIAVGILIAAAVISDNDSGSDHFTGERAWLYVAIIGGCYLLSRGLAKSGSREPYTPQDATGGSDVGLGERVTKAVQVLKDPDAAPDGNTSEHAGIQAPQGSSQPSTQHQ